MHSHHDQPPIGKGTIVNHQYLIQELLGEGGMGAVYRAITLHDERPRTVALKILHPTATNVDMTRFARERDTMLGLKHRNVIELLDFGAYHVPGQAAVPFLVLEYADGGSLAGYLNQLTRQGKDRRLPADQSAWIIFQAAAGLRAARTVHRDLKPENLLLTRRSSTQTVDLRIGSLEDASVVKVADWGLVMDAKTHNQRLTKSQDVFGTPLYMSPEQCRGSKHLTGQSDLYSLGCIFYELVVGRPPFEAPDAYELLKAHNEAQVCYPSHCPPSVVPVLDALLRKNPEERPRSLLALQDLLRPLLGLPTAWQYAAGDTANEARGAQANSSGLLRYLRRLFNRSAA